MFLPQGNNPTPFLSVIPKTEGGNSECFLLVQQIPGGRPALGQGRKEGRAIAQPSLASPSPGQLLSPSCHQLATPPPKGTPIQALRQVLSPGSYLLVWNHYLQIAHKDTHTPAQMLSLSSHHAF